MAYIFKPHNCGCSYFGWSTRIFGKDPPILYLHFHYLRSQAFFCSYFWGDAAHTLFRNINREAIPLVGYENRVAIYRQTLGLWRNPSGNYASIFLSGYGITPVRPPIYISSWNDEGGVLTAYVALLESDLRSFEERNLGEELSLRFLQEHPVGFQLRLSAISLENWSHVEGLTSIDYSIAFYFPKTGTRACGALGPRSSVTLRFIRKRG